VRCRVISLGSRVVDGQMIQYREIGVLPVGVARDASEKKARIATAPASDPVRH
jgi:hypothetical protein